MPVPGLIILPLGDQIVGFRSARLESNEYTVSSSVVLYAGSGINSRNMSPYSSCHFLKAR